MISKSGAKKWKLINEQSYIGTHVIKEGKSHEESLLACNCNGRVELKYCI